MVTVIATLSTAAAALFMHYGLGFPAEACMFGFMCGMVAHLIMLVVSK